MFQLQNLENVWNYMIWNMAETPSWKSGCVITLEKVRASIYNYTISRMGLAWMLGWDGMS